MAVTLKIEEKRLSKNLTRRELANAIGVTPAAVDAWEKGRSSISTPLLSRVADVLECTTDELLGRKEVKDGGMEDPARAAL